MRACLDAPARLRAFSPGAGNLGFVNFPFTIAKRLANRTMRE